MNHQINLITTDGKKIQLEEGVFGRDGQGRDFIKNNSNISRVHARFFIIHESWFIEDYNSINGTFLNGEKLEPFEKVKLKSDDEISFSSGFKVKVELEK
jgi:pSer/pThr/pTyr-binding forkhead associated (FHA) protein